MKRVVIGLVAMALLTVSAAASAQATILERFHFEDQWSFQEDCGFPVQVAGSGSGLFILREGKNKDDGVFPFMDRFTYRETWTNMETGEWFVIRGHQLVNEVKATHLGGTLFEFRLVEAGQPLVVEDSDGNVIERNRGSVRVTYLFDNGGDDAPGGLYLGDIDIRIAGPHPGRDKHPCEYAVELIG